MTLDARTYMHDHRHRNPAPILQLWCRLHPCSARFVRHHNCKIGEYVSGETAYGTTAGAPLKRGFAFSQFAKYVRPGYQRVARQRRQPADHGERRTGQRQRRRPQHLHRRRRPVTAVTIALVTKASDDWLVTAIKLPAGPSRHRVAVWRELRRVGAVPLSGGVWAAPAAPVFAEGFDRVAELVRRADGNLIVLDAGPRDEPSRAALLGEFNAARAAEWTEFASECAKYEAEIAKERHIGKLTVAELDEEEQSLDRLRRWFRELKARDIFGVAEGARAEDHLKRCAEALDGYAAEVYRAVHAPLGGEGTDA
jgi:hypothetical protein